MGSSSIKDISLAAQGRTKTEWAANQMGVLRILRGQALREKPFQGLRIGCCLHITSETANLIINLRVAGASVALCASNPLSTQDEVAAYLVKEHGVSVYGIRGEHSRSYYANIKAVMATMPHLVIDDGADLIASLHRQPRFAGNVMGATEETTTGVIRLRNLAQKGLLQFPVIAVNDARTKHFFDNRYGTGQSTVDGILRATNLLLCGLTVVVCGYGWCGRGIAARCAGMGARVIVTEVNPLRALEATMDGFAVMPMSQAARAGDLFITSTGNADVISFAHIRAMKDGAVLANAGHFNVEIDVASLRAKAARVRRIRPSVEEFTLKGGKRVFLLGDGRLVNLACADGHPSAVMDMSFANQYLALRHLRMSRGLARAVHEVPAEVDEQIAVLKLRSMGVRIDTLTRAQRTYLSSWNLGT